MWQKYNWVLWRLRIPKVPRALLYREIVLCISQSPSAAGGVPSVPSRELQFAEQEENKLCCIKKFLLEQTAQSQAAFKLSCEKQNRSNCTPDQHSYTSTTSPWHLTTGHQAGSDEHLRFGMPNKVFGNYWIAGILSQPPETKVSLHYIIPITLLWCIYIPEGKR